MKWKPIPLGPLQTNCYLISNGQACLIIDPGEEGGKLIQIINKAKLKPQAILLTHAHFDHIGAVDTIREHYHIPVYIHKKEANWLVDPALNGSEYFMVGGAIRAKQADFFFEKEEKKTIGDFEFDLYETPGHSPGSVSFYFESLQLVVSGDALFKSSIGRTDLPGGNEKTLLESIHKKLLTLPEETLVLSGHGPVTTIGDEMNSNPFIHGF